MSWSAPISEPRRATRRHHPSQKKLVKLKTQRKTAKKVSSTRPKACNPYGPTRILEAAEFSIVISSYELFKSIPKRASSQNTGSNTIAIGPARFTEPRLTRTVHQKPATAWSQDTNTMDTK
jgi:hypothetical protein